MSAESHHKVAPLSPGAPGRHMASGLPGGSFNTTYFVLCGGGLTAALVYVSTGESTGDRSGCGPEPVFNVAYTTDTVLGY